jgi:hypothetical protein
MNTGDSSMSFAIFRRFSVLGVSFPFKLDRGVNSSSTSTSISLEVVSFVALLSFLIGVKTDPFSSSRKVADKEIAKEKNAKCKEKSILEE